MPFGEATFGRYTPPLTSRLATALHIFPGGAPSPRTLPLPRAYYLLAFTLSQLLHTLPLHLHTWALLSSIRPHCSP
jgi:hypothetical protein